MIYDVMNTHDTIFADGSVGINAQIAAVNSEKSTDLPTVEVIQIWGVAGEVAKLPSQLTGFPALVFVWENSADVGLISQVKRKPKHGLKVHYFDVEPDQNRARKFMALMQTAFMRVLDNLAGVDTIAEIGPARFDTRRWRLAGQGDDVARMEISYEVMERDENA